MIRYKNIKKWSIITKKLTLSIHKNIDPKTRLITFIKHENRLHDSWTITDINLRCMIKMEEWKWEDCVAPIFSLETVYFSCQVVFIMSFSSFFLTYNSTSNISEKCATLSATKQIILWTFPWFSFKPPALKISIWNPRKCQCRQIPRPSSWDIIAIIVRKFPVYKKEINWCGHTEIWCLEI